jgi:hypothetical protein
VDIAPAQQQITIANTNIDLAITLHTRSSALREVTIVAKKPLLRQEDDKTIVDAEPLAGSSTNAFEVLEKSPGVVIDQDGNVYLSSSAAATIYINGRQMRMSNDDIAALLKSLPAGSIQKIEIIRTPSTKYDAANSGGIVNIVLKKGIRIGTTGSLNIRADQGVYNTTSAGLSLNHSTGPFNAYIAWQYTGKRSFDDIRSERLIHPDTILSQSSSTRFKNTTHYIGAGVGMTFSKKFEAAYDLRLTANTNTSHALSTNDFTSQLSKDTYYRSQTPIENAGSPVLISNALTTKLRLDSLGSELTAEIDYTHNNNGNRQAYANGSGTLHAPSDLLDIRTDLSLKLPRRFLLETGGKLSDVSNKNEAIYFIQPAGGAQQPDPYQTNTFHYTENIHSAYLQISKTFNGTNFKAGLRYENTQIAGHQLIPHDTSFAIDRNDLFPYFYIRRPLFSIFGYPLTGNITWRRSITRPGYDALNPSPKYIDPYTYNVGNTGLRPQFTTNYEINATYNDFPVFAVGINDTRNVFSQVTYQNDSTDIAFRTWDNLGKYREFYWRLFGGLPAGGKYFMYAGVQFNRISYDGIYENAPLRYHRASWTFFTGHEIKLSRELKFNLNGWMYVNGFRMFNELQPLGQLNASLTRTFLDKKLSIILSAADIFLTNRSTFSLHQGSVAVNGVRTQDSRRIGITARYNFGFTRHEEKKEFMPPEFIQLPGLDDPVIVAVENLPRQCMPLLDPLVEQRIIHIDRPHAIRYRKDRKQGRDTIFIIARNLRPHLL